VFAVVTNDDGSPRPKAKIATYVAPPRARPSRPRGLRVRRTKSRRGRDRVMAPLHARRVADDLGRAVVGCDVQPEDQALLGGVHRVVPSKVAVNAAVAGITADLRTGRYARVRLAGGKTRTGARASLQRRSCRIDNDVADR